MKDEEKDALIQEGRNQVLYLMLVIGDENVAHDNFHPRWAHILYETRREIVQRFKHPTRNGVMNTIWPYEWPDFEHYTYTPG